MLVEVTTFLACTVTAYAALASGLLSLVAVIVAVPGATAVILPSESTVAIASSLEDQVTEALVAVSGSDSCGNSHSITYREHALCLIESNTLHVRGNCNFGLGFQVLRNNAERRIHCCQVFRHRGHAIVSFFRICCFNCNSTQLRGFSVFGFRSDIGCDGAFAVGHRSHLTGFIDGSNRFVTGLVCELDISCVCGEPA